MTRKWISPAGSPWASMVRRERLAELWGLVPQISTAEIGRRMGMHKNAIVSAARRMELPPRPNPVVRKDSNAQAPLKRQVRGRASMPAHIPVQPDPTPAPVKRLLTGGCQWQHGARGSYVACGEPVVRQSYCLEHAGKAFLRAVAEDDGRRGGNNPSWVSYGPHSSTQVHKSDLEDQEIAVAQPNRTESLPK